MAPTTLSAPAARQASKDLDAIIEARIDMALTPAVLAKLAAKGVTESAARIHLRKRAAEGLLAEYAK